MHRILPLLLLLCAWLPAQVVTVRNLSPVPFDGWKRTTVDVLPPHERCEVDGVKAVLGRRVGLDTWALDVLVSLAPGETRTVDLATAQPSSWTPADLPADLERHFGGMPQLNGQPFVLVGARPDGAAVIAHWQLRFGRMMVAELFATMHPDRPAFALGEVLVTCSNPTVPDMGETVGDLRLTFGDAAVVAPGGGPGLLAPGLRFADGQARALPVSFVWLRHLRTAADWSTAGAAAHLQIGAVGIRNLLPGGNPTLPRDFNLPAWVGSHWFRTLGALRDWTHPVLGPAADTGQTGAVEDQTFVGGECFLPGGVGAELVRYFAALQTSGHPMHHREIDGTVVDRDRRPNLRMFYSRPHSSGSDRLGKPRDLTVVEANGWNGPDAQHWTTNTLFAACRLTGSLACQRLLEHHARNYLIQLTTTPGWSTSELWSVRELLWEGLLVRNCWIGLEDRAFAQRVLDHARERLRRIVVPKWSGKDIRDVRRDDLRLGTGDWWMPWQEAAGAYGADVMGELTGVPEARAVALAGAKRILADAWVREGGRWVESELLALDGRRSRSGMFTAAWLPLAIAVVLRHEPNNERARSIWAQIVADADGNGRWIPPGVR